MFPWPPRAFVIGLRGMAPRGPIAKFASDDTFSIPMTWSCGWRASFAPPVRTSAPPIVPAWTRAYVLATSCSRSAALPNTRPRSGLLGLVTFSGSQAARASVTAQHRTQRNSRISPLLEARRDPDREGAQVRDRERVDGVHRTGCRLTAGAAPGEIGLGRERAEPDLRIEAPVAGDGEEVAPHEADAPIPHATHGPEVVGDHQLAQLRVARVLDREIVRPEDIGQAAETRRVVRRRGAVVVPDRPCGSRPAAGRVRVLLPAGAVRPPAALGPVARAECRAGE